MYNSFKEYYTIREGVEFSNKFDELCSEITDSNLDIDVVIEHAFIPAVVNGEYSNHKDLLNEFRHLINRLLGRNSGEVPGDEMEKLSPISQKDPLAFRSRPNRQTSRSDLMAQNKETEEDNIGKDQRNMGRQRNQLRQQGGNQMLQIKQEILQVAQQLKSSFSNIVKTQGMNLKQKFSDPHKADVLRIFIQHITDAINSFEPEFAANKDDNGPSKINLVNYMQDTDFSGVKSGIKTRNTAPQPKKPYYSTDGQNGTYGKNQVKGDAERSQEAGSNQDFASRARRNVRAN